MSKTQNQKIVYVPGGPVQATPGGLYIPRQADEKLLELCESGTFTYILTPRQMGKSSLMLDTVGKLNEKGIQTAVVDLQSLGVQVQAEEWYLGILTIIEDQLLLDTDIIEWWKSHNYLGITQRLTLFFQKILLAQTSTPIVIFVDEIDTTLSLNFSDDFYTAIRYLYNSRAQIPELHRLSFVLIGVAAPGDLIKDRDRTPFNIGQRLDLVDFTTEEALPLVAGLKISANENAQILDWVMQWTSGHPYLTQRTFRELANKNLIDWSKEEVDKVVAETFFGEKSREDNNLQFVRDMLIHSDRGIDAERILTTYREVLREKNPVFDDEQSLVISHLKLSGVVCNKGGVLQVRNEIYRQVFNENWVKSHLPVNWKQLLVKAAMAAGIIFLVALIPVSIFAWISMKEAVSARENEEKQREIAEAKSAELERKSEELIKVNLDLESSRAELIKTNNELASKSEALTKANQETIEALANETKAKELAEERRKQAERATENEKIAKNIAETKRKQAEEATENERLAKIEAEEASLRERDARNQAEEGFKEAEIQTIKANNALQSLYTEFGTQQLNINKPFHAAVFLSDAYELWNPRQRHNDGKISNLLLLLGRAMKPIDALRFSLEHQEVINSVEFAPDGKRIVTSSRDEARIWDVETGKSLVAFNHQGYINSAKFSFDGKKVITSGNDRTAKIWDAETGTVLVSLEHQYSVRTAEFSSNGKKVVTTDSNKIVKLWDAQTGKPLTILKDIGKVNSANFSLDEKKLVTVDDNRAAKIWDVETGKLLLPKAENPHAAENRNPLASLEHQSNVRTAEFSPDEKWIMTIDTNETVKLWDAKTQKLHTFLTHSDVVSSARFSPDGKRVVTAGADDTAKIWDVETGNLIDLLEHEGNVYVGEFSSDGKKIMTMEDNNWSTKIWDVTTGDLIASFKYPGIVDSAKLSPDGEKLVIAGHKTVRVWDVQTGKFFTLLKNQYISSTEFSPDAKRDSTVSGNRTTVVFSAKFSPDRKKIVTASSDNTAKIWDVETERVLLSLNHLGHVFSAEFSRDSKKVVTASNDRTVKVWNVETGKELLSLNHQDIVLSADFSPDGKKIVAADINKTAKIWDVETRRELLSLNHQDAVWSAKFSPDGKKVATASSDKTVKVWNVETGEVLLTLPYAAIVKLAEFSPDGKKIVISSNDGTTKIWDAETGKELLSLSHQGVVNSAVFSPDGKRIVTASDDRTVKIWDVETRKALVSLSHQSIIRSAAFSPDGKKVITVSEDAARIWDIAPETRTPQEIKEIIGRKVPLRHENGVLISR